MRKTQGQVEAQIGEALIQFEKEYMGRGPQETKAYILDDMILVRLKGVLTPAEQQMVKNPQGTELIKRVRSHLLEQGRELLTKAIETITELTVVSLHTDVSTKTGERVIIFTLEENLEYKIRGNQKP